MSVQNTPQWNKAAEWLGRIEAAISNAEHAILAIVDCRHPNDTAGAAWAIADAMAAFRNFRHDSDHPLLVKEIGVNTTACDELEQVLKDVYCICRDSLDRAPTECKAFLTKMRAAARMIWIVPEPDDHEWILRLPDVESLAGAEATVEASAGTPRTETDERPRDKFEVSESAEEQYATIRRIVDNALATVLPVLCPENEGNLPDVMKGTVSGMRTASTCVSVFVANHEHLSPWNYSGEFHGFDLEPIEDLARVFQETENACKHATEREGAFDDDHAARIRAALCVCKGFLSRVSGLCERIRCLLMDVALTSGVRHGRAHRRNARVDIPKALPEQIACEMVRGDLKERREAARPKRKTTKRHGANLPEERGTNLRPARHGAAECPKCQSKNTRVSSTPAYVRYFKCRGCGASFKKPKAE